MDIDVRKYGDVQVVRLRGSLTLGSPVDDLRQTLENALGAGDSRLVLNLSDVRFIDSSGIGALVKALTSSKRLGGSLKLVNPSKLAVQTLKMCHLLPLFDVYDEEQQAVQSYN